MANSNGYKIDIYKISSELVSLAQIRNLVQISSFTSAHQYIPLYKLVDKYVPKGLRVLDWGTGIGHFSYFLCRSGYKTVGFSMEDYSFKDWLENYQYRFVKGNKIEPINLPFNNNFFDSVVSMGVLEHVREFGGNEIGSMKEIFRILKPGGIFVCFHLPNHYSLIEYLGKLLTRKFHHNYRFKEEQIKKLNIKTGFKMIEIKRYGFLPRNSFGRLPKILRYSKHLAHIWDKLDIILGYAFSYFCQNYYFIVYKPKS